MNAEQVGQLDHGYISAINDIETVLKSHDLPYELLNKAQASARWPGMKFEDNVIFSPDGGIILGTFRTFTVAKLVFLKQSGCYLSTLLLRINSKPML